MNGAKVLAAILKFHGKIETLRMVRLVEILRLGEARRNCVYMSYIEPLCPLTWVKGFTFHCGAVQT